MLKSLLLYIAPLVLTPLLAGAIRLFGGPQRGARVAGLGVMVAFALSWVYFVRPGWAPVSDLTRIGHIALGATLVGFLLDLLSPPRFVAAVAGAIVILVSTWASVSGGLAIPSADGPIVLAAALAVIAFLILARMDAVRGQGVTAVVLMGIAAAGVAVIARVTHDPALATTGLILALALIAYAIPQAVAGLPVGDSIVLGAGGALLALTWAVAHAHPEIRLAMLLVPLIFFAEGTAKRVPLPQARISTLLYPLLLAVLAALPLGLAVLVAYVAFKG